jgi:tyrosinase
VTVAVSVSGLSVAFFVSGRFGRPSVNDGDVTLEARSGTALVGSVKIMVRVRKNANTLTSAERDRLVSAFARLNNQG